MKRTIGVLVIQVLAALATFVGTTGVVQGQGLQYTEETRMRLEGLGIIGRLIGRTTVEGTTSVQGGKMRVDSEKESSTITDADGGRFITLNHKRKEYTEMTFEDMAKWAEQMAEQTQQQIEEAQEEVEEEQSDEEQPEVKYSFDFKADATGETADIAGYEAKQLLMTLKVNFEVEGEDEEGNPETARGNFYALVDSWVSDDVDGYEAVAEFQGKMAESMGEVVDASGLAQAMQTAFQADPRMKAASERLAEEMDKVEGMPLRTTTYFIIAPAEEELDVDLALGKKKTEKKRSGLGGLARGALKSRGISFGGEQNEDKPAEVAEQKTLMSMSTEVKEIKTGALDGSLFGIPAGYKEVSWEESGK